MRQVIGRWKLRSFSNFQIGLITALPDALESERRAVLKEQSATKLVKSSLT
jgi:hypothetical protein